MRGARPRVVALIILGGALVAVSAEGADVDASSERGAMGSSASKLSHHLLGSTRLLDDPGGWRSRLERLGIGLQLFSNHYLGWKPQGGAEADSTFGHSASYDFFTRIDFGELASWRGLEFLLHVKGQYDRNINPDVGALSNPIDDADFDEPIYVDELWLQQAFLGDRARVRAGFLEQQTMFDRNAYANSEDRQFLTTFLDNNPIVPLPNGIGAVLLASPLDWLELAAGVADADNVPTHAGFDTAFDGLESLTGHFELSLRPRLRLPGTYRIGVFRDGRRKTVFRSRNPETGVADSERGHFGAYLSFDQLAFREPRSETQGLGLFARFGYADPDVNEIAWFWSLGLQYVGLVPRRDNDVLGLGIYEAIGSNRFRDGVDPDFDQEIGIELYYRIALLPWLAVTPDLQYIIDPGASGNVENAVVAVLRFRVTF